MATDNDERVQRRLRAQLISATKVEDKRRDAPTGKQWRLELEQIQRAGSSGPGVSFGKHPFHMNMPEAFMAESGPFIATLVEFTAHRGNLKKDQEGEPKSGEYDDHFYWDIVSWPGSQPADEIDREPGFDREPDPGPVKPGTVEAAPQPAHQRNGGSAPQPQNSERVSIERQVCLKAATEIVTTTPCEDTTQAGRDAIKLAEVFARWVRGADWKTLHEVLGE